MEKKRLGRGLEDIADIFISQKKENIPAKDLISENARKVTDWLDPEYATKTSETSVPVHEDGNIAAVGEKHNFDSSNSSPKPSYQYDQPGRDDVLRNGNLENAPKDCTNDCEITERITINKKMGYLNTEGVQQSIVNSFLQHLHQNYKIKKIELEKMSEVSRPRMKHIIEENILIYIKEAVKNGN